MDTESPEAGEVIAPPADAPEPTTEGGADSQPAEGGELDITTLPQAAQDYIHELREEAKDRRKEHEPYKNAFSAYNEAEQEYLLNMVTTLAVDQETGAKAMKELSHRMLGIEEAAEEAANDPALQEEAAKEGLTEEQYRQVVREEMQQEAMFAQIEAETIAVGFTPGTAEANKLWDLAVALGEDDLSKVAPIARQALGLPEPEAAEEKEVLQAADINPAPAESFPANAASNAGSDGTNATEKSTPHPIGSPELRDQVTRRIEAANQPGR